MQRAFDSGLKQRLLMGVSDHPPPLTPPKKKYQNFGKHLNVEDLRFAGLGVCHELFGWDEGFSGTKVAETSSLRPNPLEALHVTSYIHPMMGGYGDCIRIMGKQMETTI